MACTGESNGAPRHRDPEGERPSDLVERQFVAAEPNFLWVADLERHEALLNPAVMKGHWLRLVAASQ